MKYIILLMICMIPIALADYGTVGQNNYNLDEGIFNAALETATTTGSKVISNGFHSPLVSDLDGDGVQEIYVIDGSDFKIFQGNQLDVVDTLALPFTPTTISNIVTYDIDSDGYKEVIFSDVTNSDILIIQYNGTVITLESQLNIGGLGNYDDGEHLIGCPDDQNACMLVHAEHLDVQNGVTATSIRALPFNVSEISVTVHPVIDTDPDRTVFCFPKIKSVAYADYDNDGNKEFVFSAWEGHDSTGSPTNDLANIYYVNMTGMTAMELERTSSTTQHFAIHNVFDTIGETCETELPQNFFSSPIVFNIDSASGNGLETILAANHDGDDTFKILSWKGTTNDKLDDYPELSDADGIIISNPFQANAFHDTDDNDFCVFGFAQDDNELDVVCASENTGLSQEHREFKVDIDDLELTFNITLGYDNYSIISHSSDQSEEITSFGGDVANLDEVVNSFGVWQLDWSDGYSVIFTSQKTLKLLYQNPQDDTAVIMADAESIGNADIIALSNTNLYYIDDGFTNTAGQITEIVVNPCIDSVWQENTSVQVQITVEDIDSDFVSARAKLYNADANEQDSDWSINTTSGTTFAFNFIANKTITNGQLVSLGRDVENPLNTDSQTQNFNVQSEGVEFGDCTSTFSFDLDADEDLIEGTDIPTNNSISSGVTQIATTLNLSPTLFWLILMLLVIIAMFFYGNEQGWEAKNTVVMTIMAMAMMIIIGTLLTFVSIAVVITLVVIGGIGIAIFLRQKFVNSA